MVKQFGSGGNLAVPLWSGLTNHAGNLGEIIAYDRQLTDAEVEAAVEGMLALLEPVIIIVLGGIIGFIVVSLYLPIFSLGDVVSGNK